MPERLECEVLQKARYINTLTFTFYVYLLLDFYFNIFQLIYFSSVYLEIRPTLLLSCNRLLQGPRLG